MVQVPKQHNQTLRAMDQAIIQQNKLRRPSNSLGMSSIGKECWRELFYSFRNAAPGDSNIIGIKAAEDGDIQEEVYIKRLQLLPYITLITEDPDIEKDPNSTEKNQILVSTLLGHLKGYLDGMIIGILEAPKTWHVWEMKCKKEVGAGGFNKLTKLINELGEKNALKEWNIEYYAQAQMYMHLAPATRHYMTVCTPGGRKDTSLRTEYNKKYAESLIDKAKAIIFDQWSLPAKITDNPESQLCVYCNYQQLCHHGVIPLPHCKTCRYSKPVKDQQWECTFHEKIIKRENLLLCNCNHHIYNHALIQLELIQHYDDHAVYQTPEGLIVANCAKSGLPGFEHDIDVIYTSQELHREIKNINNLNKNILKIQKTFNGSIE